MANPRMAMSTAARSVVAIGGTGLALAVLNQMTAPQLDPPLERAAVLASILAVLLMLVGLLWERVQPEAAARSQLTGREGLQLDADLPEPLRRELAWGSTMLLTATPAAVVLLQWNGTPLLRRGLLADTAYEAGPIARRCQQNGKAISLVDLRLYPGREEFSGLLADLPAVVVQPLGAEGLLLLGGWSARCFSRSDLAWIEGWAQRLQQDWGPTLSQAFRADAVAAPGSD
ncbi:MAG: cofactor assembly of complex C subunit B [Cyanobacteriota bacterium]